MSTFIHPTAVIYPGVNIGEDCYIGPFCVIGAPPEKRDTTSNWSVVIGAGTTLAKAVVVDRGINQDTIIGRDCYLMSGAHVGHDCEVWHGVTIAAGAVIAGHCIIGSEANIGIGAVIHQYSSIPKRVMIGAGAVVTKKTWPDMLPSETWAGNPARLLGPNKKYIKPSDAAPVEPDNESKPV